MGYGFGRLNDYAEECHRIAQEHGFWDDLDASDVLTALAKLMLITTEVAEAAEAIRHGDMENYAEELADICIRVFDSAAARGINLEQAIVDKMEVNRNRERMHGKKA